MNTPLGTWLATLVLTSTAAFAQLTTGFENPPYVSGQISGQNGWTSSANPETARVLTAAELAAELTTLGMTPGQTVHGGSQALMVSGAGVSNATIRTVSGLEAERFVLLDVWARPLTGAATGNIFLTLEDVGGVRAAAFRFGPGTIDYGSNVPGIWQPTSITWNVDTWYRLTLSLDYLTKRYDFWIDGVLMNSTPIEFYNPASVNLQQVRIFRGSNQGGMIVDDLTLVPEPTTAVAALFGAFGLLSRRRRRFSGR